MVKAGAFPTAYAGRFMDQINLGEVYYRVIRKMGLPEAKIFLENILRLPVDIFPPDSELIWNAAEIKAR